MADLEWDARRHERARFQKMRTSILSSSSASDVILYVQIAAAAAPSSSGHCSCCCGGGGGVGVSQEKVFPGEEGEGKMGYSFLNRTGPLKAGELRD